MVLGQKRKYWSSEGVGITLRITDYIGKSYYTDKTRALIERLKRYPYPDESKRFICDRCSKDSK